MSWKINKKRLLAYIVSISCLFVFAYLFRDSLPGMVTVLRTASPAWLVLAFLITLMGIFLISLRMRMLAFHCGLAMSVRRFFYATLIGLFFSNFVPSAVASDMVKSYYLRNKAAGISRVMPMALIDRFIGLITMFLICIFSLNYIDNIQLGYLYYAVVLLCMAGIVAVIVVKLFCSQEKLIAWVVAQPRLEKFKLTPMLMDIIHLIYHPRVFIALVAVSALSTVCSGLTLWCIAGAVNADISIFVFWAVVPLVALAVLFPTINGLGVREGFLIAALSGYASREVVLSISVLLFAVTVCAGLLGGSIFLLRYKLKVKQL